MTTTILRQVLTIFEEAQGPLSISVIARELAVSPARLEGMLQHWVRKGRIREIVEINQCGSCGTKGNCPFVVEFPRSYELVTDHSIILEDAIKPACHRTR